MSTSEPEVNEASNTEEEVKIINQMIDIKRNIEKIKKEGCQNLLNMI